MTGHYEKIQGSDFLVNSATQPFERTNNIPISPKSYRDYPCERPWRPKGL
jgi:hypothetical protein